MFIYSIPYDMPTKKNPITVTEASYFANDREKLSMFKCPKCSEYLLYRGVVYIGCFGCLSYFSEQDIILANIE